MKWDIMPLNEATEIIMGQSPKSSSYNDKGDGLPFFQGKAEFGHKYPTAQKYCSEPIKIANNQDILLSVRAPVGAVNIATEKCCIGRGLAAIRRLEGKTDYLYLYYYFLSKKRELESIGVGSTFQAISKADIESLLIPLPPLHTQKQIAQVLDEADALIQKRKRAIAKLDELVQSVFLEMFGDPVHNLKGWDIKEFSHFAIIDTQMVKDFSLYQDYLHVGIENIEKDTGNIFGCRTVAEEKIISGKYLFSEKHIIYSKIRPYLNKVALPNFAGVCSADAYPILVNENVTNRYFFAFLLRSKAFLDHVSKFSERTNIPKVNKKQLLSFKGICPPLSLQNEFAKFYQSVQSQKALMQQQLTKMEENFHSLLQRAFKGELEFSQVGEWDAIQC